MEILVKNIVTHEPKVIDANKVNVKFIKVAEDGTLRVANNKKNFDL